MNMPGKSCESEKKRKRAGARAERLQAAGSDHEAHLPVELGRRVWTSHSQRSLPLVNPHDKMGSR